MASYYALQQHKLDVSDKSRSNLFAWRGQFTPQFVEYLLREFAAAGDVVLDPFCGSGTILLECGIRDLVSHGCEINPAAYAMSKFYSFCNTPVEERRRLAANATEAIERGLQATGSALLLRTSSDFRERHGALLEFAKGILSSVSDKRERLLILLTLFNSESSKQRHLGTAVSTTLAALRKNLFVLPCSNAKIAPHLRDARTCHEILEAQANLVITSPPYINVFNYHQNHRALLELLGFDILRIAQSEIGSNRKNRGNRFRTVVQYCLEMEQTLDSVARCLKPGGLLIMIVGRESRVRGVPFSNSGIVTDLIKSAGGFEEPVSHERAFVNRFGEKIWEDILISRKTRSAGYSGNGRAISLRFLREALGATEGDVRLDIENAIEDAEAIHASPYFRTSEVV